MKTPRPPAEPPAGPRGSRKIKFPISYLNGLIDPARSDKLNIGGARLITEKRFPGRPPPPTYSPGLMRYRSRRP